MKPLSNKLMAAVFAAILATACAIPGQANEIKKEKEQKDTIPVELKYKGTIGDQPAFELVFSNHETTLYTVTIRDNTGGVWYKDKIKGAQFSKTYVLKTEEMGNAPLEFEISTAKADKPVVYKVRKDSRVIESLVISKQ